MNRRKVLMGAAAAVACTTLQVTAVLATVPAAPGYDAVTLEILSLWRELSPENKAIFLAELRKMDAGLPNAIEGTAPNLLVVQSRGVGRDASMKRRTL